MPRTYTIPFNGLTSLTAVPFLQIATPATMGVVLVEFHLGQEAGTTSEQRAITFLRRTTASTLPTATTPAALDDKGPASLLTGTTTTCAVGVASATGTAGNQVLRRTFNVLTGLDWVPVPEGRITVGPSGFLTVQFVTAPSALTWSGELLFMEGL